MDCFVLGATGEVGKSLSKHLSSSARLIVRRKIESSCEVHVVPDFEKIAAKDFNKEIGFCALGTTRRKAGSAEEFRRIDYDLVLKAAQQAKESGCKYFALVSSMNANQDSSFLYPRVKGEIENALIDLGFEHLSIFRPGFLKCNRTESRLGERVAGWFMPIMDFVFRNKYSVSTEDVAKAMIKDANEWKKGNKRESVSFIENKEIIKLAKE